MNAGSEHAPSAEAPILEQDEGRPIIEARGLGRWYGEVVGLSDLTVTKIGRAHV